MRSHRLATALLLALPFSCSTPQPSKLGAIANPIRAATYLGEFEYVTRLQCPDGTKPHLQRLPRHPMGPYGNPLVGYRVRCIYLNRESQVYVDTHHLHYIEEEPVPGFSFSRGPDLRRLFWLADERTQPARRDP